jgi:two-component system KDP operon response regulator KdpE
VSVPGHSHLVLVIDDEVQLVRAVRTILESRGYEVVEAGTGAQAMDALLSRTPDLIVLDLTLPDTDGLDLLVRLRSFTDIPILVLSARDSEQDKVVAITTGADDYLTKPFSAGEFLARVGVVLRRTTGSQAAASLQVADLSIDFAHRRVTVSGREVTLTPTEYAILEALASNPDRVMTWRQIVDAAWGSDLEADAATLRVHISNLRRKIEPHPGVPRYLLTEPRVGFRFSTRA